MYIAEVRFKEGPEGIDDEYFIDNLTSCWRGNGQVLGKEFAISYVEGVYRLVLMIPTADALDSRHDGEYVLRHKERLTQAGIKGPFITLVSEEAFCMPTCVCEKPASYILYTTFSSLESSLRCGDCFGPIPTYRLKNQPTDNGELHDLLRSWQSDYASCDSLQMNCRTGEKFGLREISNFDSSLSKRGIELCKFITQDTKVPTYYYLHRYRSRSRSSELKRRCPSCGGEWLLKEKLHDTFDFKCDRCRLLSNIALSLPPSKK